MSEPTSDEPRWRFFHGNWDDDPRYRDCPYADVGQLTWAAARDKAREVFSRHIGGDCRPCEVQAEEEIARLDATEPGTRFEGNIEGDDVLIVLDGASTAADVGPWVQAACGCVWRESRPEGLRVDPSEPRACTTHQANHPASVRPSPQGMAMVPVTYHHDDPTRSEHEGDDRGRAERC